MSFKLPSCGETRRCLFLLLLSTVSLVPISCTVAAQPKVSTWRNSTGAEAFQRLFWQAVKEKDWLQVESHMASNFVYLGADGSRDKPQEMAYLRGSDLKDFSLGEINVTGQGADAIVTYTITLAGSTSNSSPSRQMAVWQQQKSGWVLVALAEAGPNSAH